jgi:hypothetical protein
MSLKVKILYGIFGGEHIGKRLRTALREAGYTPVTDTNEADVILAHSAGCFWLENTPAHQKLILIDPPYWPGKTIRQRAHDRARSNLRPLVHGYSLRYWIGRNLWGAYYALFDLKRNRRIMNYAEHYNLPDIIRDHTVLLVRNQHDDWLTPDLGHLKKVNPTLRIVELPGDHDDISQYPKRYVDLIQSLYE